MPWGLAAAAVAPVAGVLLYAWLHERPRLERIVDGFVYVAVPVLVAWQIVPQAWAQRAMLPVAAVALGLVAVPLVERVLQKHAAHRYAYADDAAIVASLSGIALHALLEGAAFAGDPIAAPDRTAFAVAVALHRVLLGLVIWWLVRPRHGPILASLAVAAVPVVTVAGYLVGGELGMAGEGPGVALYQAFVAGTLLHVVFHQGRRDHDHAR